MIDWDISSSVVLSLFLVTMSNCHSFRQYDSDSNTTLVEPQAQNTTNAEGTEVQPGDKAGQPPVKKQRFELGTDENEENWELPESNAEYIHKYMGAHIAEKEIKDSILYEHPVPSNIKKVPELDSYMKNLLNDNSKFNVMKVERTLKTIQEKVHNVFGPLSKLWCLMDEERDRYPENKDLQSISSLFDQVVLLLGQTENAIAYQRRENILATLLDSGSKVKDVLKSQLKEMNGSSNEYLFGKGFEEKLLKDSKAIKKTQAVFTGLKPALKPSTSGSGAGSKRPFPSSPLFQARGRGKWRNQFGQTRGKKLFSFITPNRVFRQPGIASSPKCAPSSKEFVSSGTNSRPPVIRKNKIISGKLESVIPRPPSIRMGSGIPDTISFKPPSKEASSVTNLLQGGTSSSGQRSPRSSRETRCRSGKLSSRESIFKFDISSSQEGWGKQASNKSKGVESPHSLQSFQDGEFVTSKGVIKKRGFHVPRPFNTRHLDLSGVWAIDGRDVKIHNGGHAYVSVQNKPTFNKIWRAAAKMDVGMWKHIFQHSN